MHYTAPNAGQLIVQMLQTLYNFLYHSAKALRPSRSVVDGLKPKSRSSKDFLMDTFFHADSVRQYGTVEVLSQKI